MAPELPCGRLIIDLVPILTTALAAYLLTAPPVPPVQQASGPVILYDEVLSVESLERMVKVGGRRYPIFYQDDCDKAAKSTGTIDIAALSRYVAERPGGFP